MHMLQIYLHQISWLMDGFGLIACIFLLCIMVRSVRRMIKALKGFFQNIQLVVSQANFFG